MLTISVLCGCCGYSTHSLLSAHLRNVAILPAENTTTQPDLAEILTDSLVAAFRADRTLVVTDEADAHVVLSATVSSYSRDPAAYTDEQSVNRYRLAVGASVQATDRTRDEGIFDGSVSADVTYNPDSAGVAGLSSEESAARQALGKLAREIVRQVLTTW
jgi:hypothetical protein